MEDLKDVFQYKSGYESVCIEMTFEEGFEEVSYRAIWETPLCPPNFLSLP